MDFLDFIAQTNVCKTPEELVALFEKALSEYGINGFVYSLVRGGNNPGNKILHGVEGSYPEDWVKYYTDQGYLEHDPTYRRVIQSRGLFTWKSLQENQLLSTKEKKVMNEAEEAGLKRGMSLSLHGPHGEAIGFGFTSNVNQDELSKNEQSALYAIATQFHIVYSGLEHGLQDGLPIVLLSDRQREVLQWAAAGKSKPDIATIMGLSEDTVDNHFRQIFTKLRCHDKTVAVVKAIQLGLIKY